MCYLVQIRPIIGCTTTITGPFETEEEAWKWVDENNCPFADYDVLELDDEKQGEGQ